MFWSETGFLSTVKCRIAVGYALLFALSFGVVFTTVYFYWRLSHLETMDRKLSVFLNEFAYEYLTGREFDTTFGAVPFKRVPEAALRIIEQKIDGFSPLSAFRNVGDEQQFTLLGTQGGRLCRLRLNLADESFEAEIMKHAGHAGFLQKEFNSETYGEGRGQTFFLLLSPEREVLASSPFAPQLLAFLREFDYRPGQESVQYTIIRPGRHNLRLAYQRQYDGTILAIGGSLHAMDESLDRLIAIFCITGIPILLIGALVGWLLARRFVSGIDRVCRAADVIAAGDYSLRVHSAGEGSEIDHLIRTFNRMVGNTETLMNEQRNISDNIAHDLRTPLTRILGRAELAASGRQELEIYQNTVADIGEECYRMLNLINMMLEISRTESGAVEITRSRFRFPRHAGRRSAELFRCRPTEHQKLTLRLPETPVLVCCDQQKLQQVAANLLDNAIKFTPEGGRRRCRTERLRRRNPLLRRGYRLRHPRGGAPGNLQAVLPGGQQPFAARQRARPESRLGHRHSCRRQHHRRSRPSAGQPVHRPPPRVFSPNKNEGGVSPPLPLPGGCRKSAAAAAAAAARRTAEGTAAG